MRRWIPVAGVAAATLLRASVAFAQLHPGVNLNWGTCYGDGPVTGNRSFACNANAGTNTLVASFVPSVDHTQVSGAEIVVDLAAEAATLPAWWQFLNAGACRQAALTANVNYPGSMCTDYWVGQGGGGITAYGDVNYGANTSRIVAAWAVPSSPLGVMNAAIEYFGMNLVVSNAKTTGLGACAGCGTPVCLVLNSVRITTQVVNGHPIDDEVLTGGAAATNSNFVTWQGGGSPATNLGTGCPAATPAHNATWGSVKALYR